MQADMSGAAMSSGASMRPRGQTPRMRVSMRDVVTAAA